MTTGAAALIQKGARLKKLSLFANQLGDEGASEIAEALSAGSFVHLQELDVSANNIGSQGVQRLFDVLESQAAPALEVWTVTELHSQDLSTHQTTHPKQSCTCLCVPMWNDKCCSATMMQMIS